MKKIFSCWVIGDVDEKKGTNTEPIGAVTYHGEHALVNIFSLKKREVQKW